MSIQEIATEEMLASVTELEPITPLQVQNSSAGTFDYESLARFLSERQLSIKRVLFAPMNKIHDVFYVDYPNGIYSIFDLRYLKSARAKAELERMERYARNGNPNLIRKDWNLFYGADKDIAFMDADVPIPLQIFDFNHRVYEMEPESIFCVWMRIHTHVTSSKSMWDREVLDKVFSMAPPAIVAGKEADDFITVYRGMGELSRPAETAISWSSNPVNALHFANWSSRGTKFAVGQIKVKEIVAYRAGFYDENEVIVRPNTVSEIKYEDMFPATQEIFIQMIAPFFFDFQRYGEQARRLGYQVPEPEPDLNEMPDLLKMFYVVSRMYSRKYHDINHILRVLFLSFIYYHNSGDPLTKSDWDILIYFSLLHDIGRRNEDEDSEHGRASVEIIKKKGLRIGGIALTKKDYRLAHIIIEYHCIDDSEAEKKINTTPGWSKSEKRRALSLYAICKDLDALDRVRFGGLDYRMLRTPYARRLPLIAGCLLKEDILAFADGTLREKYRSCGVQPEEEKHG